MRALPLISLWVAARATAVFGQAFSVGNDNWGLKLILESLVRECQPLRMYYNVGAVPNAPDNIKWPDSAYIRFLTPESAETEWMRWTALNGTGILSWTVPLPAGKQFVVQNFQGYEQVFTVQPSGTTDCHGDGDSVQSTFSHGTIDAFVFHTLVTTSYSTYSVSGSDSQFHAVDMPSSSRVIDVPLGLPKKAQDPAPSATPQPTTSSGGGDIASSPAAPTSPASGQSGTRSTTSNPGSQAMDAPSTLNPTSPIDPSTSTNESGSGSQTGASDALPAATETVAHNSGGGVNVGAVVGGLVGALAVGVFLGMLLLFLHRRRQRNAALVRSAETPVPLIHSDASTFSHGHLSETLITIGDRKRRPFQPPPTDSDYNTDTYGTNYAMSEMPTGDGQAPPRYSRFA